MKKLSVSIDEGHVETLDERQDSGEASSRSEALRQILDEYDGLRTECDDLRAECDQLRTRLESRENRIDELEAQLARRSQVEEKVDVLAKRVDESNTAAPPWPVRWWRWMRGRGEAGET